MQIITFFQSNVLRNLTSVAKEVLSFDSGILGHLTIWVLINVTVIKNKIQTATTSYLPQELFNHEGIIQS